MPAITIGGRRGATLDLTSPLMIAAGCFGRGAPRQQAWLRGVGAIVTHTLTPEPRGRRAYPLIREAASGLLYASGLPNRGFARELADGATAWAALGLPVVVSLAADSPRTLAGMAAELDAASCAAAVELPVEPSAGADLAGIARQIAAVTDVTALPVLVKLSPVPNPLAVAGAAFAAGADAVCLAQGWPASALDGATDETLLAGPAIAPLTLRLLAELAREERSPLIGCGGIDSARAAKAYLAAGACAVQIGSALFRDPTLAAQIAAELARADAPAPVRLGTDRAGLDPRRSSGIA